jgi:transposase
MFEENLVWHALHATFKTVSEMFCVNWHTVGNIMQRYYEDNKLLFTPCFDNLRCIGVDETSYKKGHKYITVVVNQDTGGVLWVHIGYGYDILKLFFLELTPEQRANIEFITGDGARYIEQCRVDFCPEAVRCMDAFHTVSWATGAVDEVRREAYNTARLKLEALMKAAKEAEKEAVKAEKNGSEKSSKKGSEKAPAEAKKKRSDKDKKKGVVIDPEMEDAQQRMDALKGSKYAYLHNPKNRTEGQIGKIELIARTEPALNEGLILKDQLATILRMDKESAKEALGIWVKDAAGAMSPQFVALSEKIERHIPAILATIEHGLSNARIEAINNKIKVTSRMGYGYRNIDNLIALIMIRCSSYHMPYPGRTRRFAKLEKGA